MSIQRQLTDRFYSLADKAQTPDQIKAVQAHIMGSIQDGALPAYAGVPLIQDLTSRLQQLQAPRLGVNVQPQAQAPQPIAEQVMQNAMGVAALPTQRQGVESLPSGMNEESYAGGGIVAFARGGQSFEDKLAELQYGPEDDETELKTNPLFSRGIARDRLRGLPSIGSFIQNLAALNPNKPLAPVATPAQTAAFMGDVYPPVVTKGVQFDPTAGGTYNPTVKPQVKAPTQAAAPEVQPQAQAQPQITPEQAVTGRFAPYEKMLEESKAATAADRETDKWLRIMQAGLGIMGSTSPYALTNVGQGAMGALKDYAGDVAAARKDEADRIRAMIALGMKKEEMAQQLGLKTRELDQELKKMGITEQHYKDWARIYAQKAAATGAGASTKMDIAKLNAVKATFATLQKSAADLTSPNYGKSPEELWSMAEAMVTGQGSTAPATTTYQWSNLGKK